MHCSAVGELLFGVLRLPTGWRRSALLDSIERLIAEAGDRLLVFDEPVSRACAELRNAREAAGRPAGLEDLMIGAVCLARGVPIATRNVDHVDGFGITVVDPWDADPVTATPTSRK